MHKQVKKKKMSMLTISFILFGITLPIINWLVFYVYTNFSSIAMAFRNGEGMLSFDNFLKFFHEFTMETSQIREALVNTLITFGILFITFPFKVLVSYFIYKKIPFYGFYRIVFFLPSIIFSVAVAMVFSHFVSVQGFVAKAVQDWMHLDYVPELLADERFANIVVLLNMVWLGFPGDLVIWGGTFARIPEDVLESGKIDGVNWWTEFTQIIVPLVWPTVALQMVLLFCGIFGASGNVFLLTNGGYGTMTLTAWMYITLHRSSGTMYTSNVYNYMSAVGVMISTVAIIISLSIRRITGKVFKDVEY